MPKPAPYVIQGSLRGKKIVLPFVSFSHTRLTTQKIKESLFQIIANHCPVPEETVFCDLFAGSGQVGIEAISRGFRYTFFYESEKKKIVHIEEWLKKHHSASSFTVLQSYRKRILKTSFQLTNIELQRKLPKINGSLDMVYFLDPPYSFYKGRTFLTEVTAFITDAIEKNKENNPKYRSLLFILQFPKSVNAEYDFYDRTYEYNNNGLAVKYNRS